MALTFRKLHPLFVGEVSPVDLRRVPDEETFARIRAGMDGFALPVFRNQPLADNEPARFPRRVEGSPHTTPASGAPQKTGPGKEPPGNISTREERGALVKPDTRRRIYPPGNRLWHTDASFQDPPGRYS